MAQAPLDRTSSIFGLIIENLGPWEILVVLILAMVVVGPDRLPEVARRIGRGIAQARTKFSSMSDEVRDVVDDPAMQPLREIGEFAMRPRQKLSEIVRLAELDLSEEAAEIKALIGQGESVRRSPAEISPTEEGSGSAATPGETTAPSSPADLPEPGAPPGDGHQYPVTMDDKLGGRRVPIDSEVAAQRRSDAGGPADAAFTTGAAPLGVARPEEPTELTGPTDPPGANSEGGGLPSPLSTPPAVTAFTARGRPLGEQIAPTEEAPAPKPNAAEDTPADSSDDSRIDPADPGDTAS